jgi:hypothetical protein
MKSLKIAVRLKIKDLMRTVGMDKPYQLWREFGGSKLTPRTLLARLLFAR